VPISITYQLTADDYVEGQRAYVSKGYPRVYLTGMVLAGSVLIGLGLWFSFASGEAQPIWLVAGVVFLFVPFVQWAQGKSEFKKHLSIQGEHTAAFGAEGITVTSPTGQGTLNWEAISRVIESDTFFLLVPGPRIFYLVPKRAFTPEQLIGFRELIARKIPQKK
jgi:hypothetical protein